MLAALHTAPAPPPCAPASGNRGRTPGRHRSAANRSGLSPARLSDYPHQFSGGLRQRAAIALALALALQPKLVIADEPVTALDVIVQRQVLDTFRTLGEQMRVATIFVTHDISRLCPYHGIERLGPDPEGWF